MAEVRELLGFKMGDHVVVTHLGEEQTAYIVGMNSEPEIMVSEVEIFYEGGGERERIASESAIRVMLSKPVPGCDCYSCTQAAG